MIIFLLKQAFIPLLSPQWWIQGSYSFAPAASLSFFRQLIIVWHATHVCVLVAQLCSTLCSPMGCSPPGSSVCGILQTRILEWVAMSFSRGSSWPRDQTQVSLPHCRQTLYCLSHPGSPATRRETSNGSMSALSHRVCFCFLTLFLLHKLSLCSCNLSQMWMVLLVVTDMQFEDYMQSALCIHRVPYALVQPTVDGKYSGKK